MVVAGLLPGRRRRRECMRRLAVLVINLAVLVLNLAVLVLNLAVLVINLAGRGFSALLPAARPWPVLAVASLTMASVGEVVGSAGR